MDFEKIYRDYITAFDAAFSEVDGRVQDHVSVEGFLQENEYIFKDLGLRLPEDRSVLHVYAVGYAAKLNSASRLRAIEKYFK